MEINVSQAAEEAVAVKKIINTDIKEAIGEVAGFVLAMGDSPILEELKNAFVTFEKGYNEDVLPFLSTYTKVLEEELPELAQAIHNLEINVAKASNVDASAFNVDASGISAV